MLRLLTVTRTKTRVDIFQMPNRLLLAPAFAILIIVAFAITPAANLVPDYTHLLIAAFAFVFMAVIGVILTANITAYCLLVLALLEPSTPITTTLDFQILLDGMLVGTIFKYRPTTVVIPFAIFAVIFTIIPIFLNRADITIIYGVYLTITLLRIWLVINVVRATHRSITEAHIVLFLGAVLTSIGLLEMVTLDGYYRVSGNSNPTEFAVLLLVFLLYWPLLLARYEHGVFQHITAFIFPLMLFVFYNTGTRLALTAAIIGAAILIVFFRESYSCKIRKATGFLLAISCCIILLLIIFNDPVIQSTTTASNRILNLTDQSVIARIGEISQLEITGFGVNEHNPGFHAEYFTILAKVGVIGLLFMLWLLVHLWFMFPSKRFLLVAIYIAMLGTQIFLSVSIFPALIILLSLNLKPVSKVA